MNDKKEEKLVKSVFKSLDNLLFKNVDKFLESQGYQKISEKFQELDHQSQKYANHILTIIILILPIALVINLSLGNNDLKNELKIKSDTLSKIHEFRATQTEVHALSTSLGSPVNITSRSDLESKMNARMRTLNLPSRKVRIQDFESFEKTNQLLETIVKFNLSDLTMSEFSNFLTLMLNEYRMRSTFIDVELDAETEFIGGTLEFMHIKRVASEPSES